MVDKDKVLPAIRRQVFHDNMTPDLFGGTLTQDQVNGIDAILDEWEVRKLTDLRWLAYMLATTYHETNMTMQPPEAAAGAVAAN